CRRPRSWHRSIPDVCACRRRSRCSAWHHRGGSAAAGCYSAAGPGRSRYGAGRIRDTARTRSLTVVLEGRGGQLTVLLQQQGDLLLGLGQGLLAFPGQHHTLLEGAEGFLQGEIAALQAFDQTLQGAERLLEVDSGFLAGHGIPRVIKGTTAEQYQCWRGCI